MLELRFALNTPSFNGFHAHAVSHPICIPLSISWCFLQVFSIKIWKCLKTYANVDLSAPDLSLNFTNSSWLSLYWLTSEPVLRFCLGEILSDHTKDVRCVSDTVLVFWLCCVGGVAHSAPMWDDSLLIVAILWSAYSTFSMDISGCSSLHLSGSCAGRRNVLYFGVWG